MWVDNETSDDFLSFKVHADLIVDVINDNDVLSVTMYPLGYVHLYGAAKLATTTGFISYSDSFEQ